MLIKADLQIPISMGYYFFKVFFLVFLLFTSCGITEIQQTEIAFSHCKPDRTLNSIPSGQVWKRKIGWRGLGVKVKVPV